MDTGEDCDNGSANSDTLPDACRTDCSRAHCGDGVKDTGEALRPGLQNGTRVVLLVDVHGGHPTRAWPWGRWAAPPGAPAVAPAPREPAPAAAGAARAGGGARWRRLLVLARVERRSGLADLVLLTLGAMVIAARRRRR